jgi:hypothetical protein
MYLSQAVLWPIYLRIASDNFQHAQHALEIQFDYENQTGSVVVATSRAATHVFLQARRGWTAPIMSRFCPDRLHWPSELGLRFRKPAHHEVRPMPL